MAVLRKMNLHNQLSEFRKRLREAADPVRAANEKRYLKSPYKFYGVTLPFIERMAKEFKKENRDASRQDILALAKRLWASEYHQEKTLAIKLLDQYREYLDMKTMPMLEGMLSEAAGWDHLDETAIHLVGAVLEKDEKVFIYLKKWSRSENFWVRRASLISQILPFRKGMGDAPLFFKLAEGMLDEKEFFIRKAIGWTLRDLSKSKPDEVFDFLMKVKDRASGLTLREGAKRLPEAQRAAVMLKKQAEP